MDGDILTSIDIASPAYLYTTSFLYIHIQTEATNDNPAAMFTKAKEKWRWSVTSDSDFNAYRSTPIIIHIVEIYKNLK